ncbi:unnamed protein product [Ceratitis capitata]|uniref:(Mediterranean fruit fly) hypothetical protein n=1 Tax=Ceratitis capitata TaxID=7213 RepID=A0A811UU81_CERCA|nr:unnamed protein product [Ceratitis capitata]
MNSFRCSWGLEAGGVRAEKKKRRGITLFRYASMDHREIEEKEEAQETMAYTQYNAPHKSRAHSLLGIMVGLLPRVLTDCQRWQAVGEVIADTANGGSRHELIARRNGAPVI